MSSKNTFSVYGDTLHIAGQNWDKLAFATLRDDYKDELQSVTWSINNGYLHNSKYGYLHRYMVEKWYGKDTLEEMTRMGFVVDHMDNDSTNCKIENLSFLSSDENKAKGFTVDKQREKLWWNIALNLFKDFSTGFYQITIFFNVDTALKENDVYKKISTIRLLYTSDYEIVINDARYILLSFEKEAQFNLNRLNFSEVKVEEAQQVYLAENDKDRAWVEIDGKIAILIKDSCRVRKINYEKGWKPKEGE